MALLKTLFARTSPEERRGSNLVMFDRRRLNAQQETLLKSVVNEFYCSAKLAVVFTSIVNARCDGTQLQNINRPSAFMPGEPVIFNAVAAGLTPSFDHPILVDVLQDYYSRLSFARSFSDLTSLAAEAEGNRYAADYLQISDVWRRICDLANRVAHQLYDVEDVRGSDKDSALKSIHTLIKLAQSGQSPCVRDDGLVSIPGWLDQRREERRSLGWKIWVNSGSARERATLQDISTGGMGLSNCRACPVGTQISVQLPDHRCLTGIVTWSQVDRMGARFLTPISLNDPVLAAATNNGATYIN